MILRDLTICGASKAKFIIISLITLLLYSAYGQKKSSTTRSIECFPKPFSIPLKERVSEVFSIITSESTIIDNVIGVRRLVPNLSVLEEQKLVFYRYLDDKIVDTIVDVSSLRYLLFYDIGGGGQGKLIPIFPAKEYILQPSLLSSESTQPVFFEILSLVAYGGRDNSTRSVDGRKIGFNNLFYSGEIVFFPFGFLFGSYLNFGIGSGLILENSRLRIPVKGEVRINFFKPDKPQIGNIVYNISDPCRFAGKSTEVSPCDFQNRSSMLKEVFRYDSFDSVCIYPEFTFEKRFFYPFLFVDGGFLFNTNFSGSEYKEGSILNKEDYSQFFASIGLGSTFFNALQIKLGYRYNRFNIVSSCPGCADSKVINVNNVHSIILMLGLKVNLIK